jgi:hypothetical protein
MSCHLVERKIVLRICENLENFFNANFSVFMFASH